MAEDVTQAGDTAPWMTVLDRALKQPPDRPTSPTVPPAGADYAPLQVIDQHLAQMQAGLARAELNAAEAERQLVAVLEPLQRWLEQMRTSREKLAEQLK